MNIIATCHLIYLAISIALTIWVARTLYRNGRIFIIQAFRGNEAMADSVNHLLLVGFYLVNIGFIAFFLRFGEEPVDVQGAIETVSTRIGVVMLILGGMHFFNMKNLDNLRRKGEAKTQAGTVPPELPPPMRGYRV